MWPYQMLANLFWSRYSQVFPSLLSSGAYGVKAGNEILSRLRSYFAPRHLAYRQDPRVDEGGNLTIVQIEAGLANVNDMSR